MDYLQEGIGLRAMGQRDPLVEYQREGFDMFSAMMEAIKEESVGFLFNVEVQLEEPVEAPEEHLIATGPGEVGGEVVVEHLLSQAEPVPADEVPAAPATASYAAPAPDPAPFAPTPVIEPAEVSHEAPPSVQQPAPAADLPAGPPVEPVQPEPVVTEPPATAATEIATPSAPQPVVEQTSAPAVAAPEQASPSAPQPPPVSPAAKLPDSFGRPDRPQAMSYSGGGTTSAGPAVPDPLTGEVKSGGPSRNQPCPCGSGRKYKRCHGDPTKQ
jgi:preprotein translocase subunit SecA